MKLKFKILSLYTIHMRREAKTRHFLSRQATSIIAYLILLKRGRFGKKVTGVDSKGFYYILLLSIYDLFTNMFQSIVLKMSHCVTDLHLLSYFLLKMTSSNFDFIPRM